MRTYCYLHQHHAQGGSADSKANRDSNFAHYAGTAEALLENGIQKVGLLGTKVHHDSRLLQGKVA